MSQTPYLCAAMESMKRQLMEKILSQLSSMEDEEVRDTALRRRQMLRKIEVLEQVVIRPEAKWEHIQHEARFLAFLLLVDTKLPRDIATLADRIKELAWLGFDMVGLEARSVFEDSITGADFQ